MNCDVWLLQTRNVDFDLIIPKLLSNLTWPIGYILLQLLDDSYSSVHACILSVICKFSEQ